MKNLWLTPLGGILGAVALFPGWFDLPGAIQTPGKVLPQQEWILVRGPDGQLITTLSDHRQGRAESYAVLNPERGDYGHFRLHPGLTAGAAVAAGDTIGQLFSSDLDRQLADLRGQLSTELAALALAQSGEKESVVRETRLRLDQARVQAAQQRQEVARLQALFDRDLVAAADLEIAAATLQVDELQIDIAAAQVQTAQTGAREEEVAWLRTRIDALRNEIDALDRKRRVATLCATLGGRFVGALSGDTLAVIQDTTAYVVLLPIRWDTRAQVAPGQTVELQLDGSSATATGTIEYLDRIARTALDGRQYLTARVCVAKPVADLVPGLLVHCSISSPPVGLVEYLRRFFTS